MYRNPGYLRLTTRLIEQIDDGLDLTQPRDDVTDHDKVAAAEPFDRSPRFGEQWLQRIDELCRIRVFRCDEDRLVSADVGHVAESTDLESGSLRGVLRAHDVDDLLARFEDGRQSSIGERPLHQLRELGRRQSFLHANGDRATQLARVVAHVKSSALGRKIDDASDLDVSGEECPIVRSARRARGAQDHRTREKADGSHRRHGPTPPVPRPGRGTVGPSPGAVPGRPVPPGIPGAPETGEVGTDPNVRLRALTPSAHWR